MDIVTSSGLSHGHGLSPRHHVHMDMEVNPQHAEKNMEIEFTALHSELCVSNTTAS